LKTSTSFPTCEIITIGSELLLGQIVDTNSAYLASELARIGIDVRCRPSVGDDLAEMNAVLGASIARCDLVITTGGLGPTQDDLTRQAVADISGGPLEFRPELMAQIEEIFRRYGYRMPEINRVQAYVPRGAIAIENPVGTAPGFIKEVRGTPIICLPGVPRELRYLWEKEVARWIKDRFSLKENRVTYRVLKVAGIGESKVDTLIGDIIKGSHNPSIGLLASPGEIRIRITAEAVDEMDAKALIAPIEKEIRARLGNKVFGADDDTLQGNVNDLLLKKDLCVVVLESFTSGKITERLLTCNNCALRESIIIPRPEDMRRRMGLPMPTNSWAIDHIEALADSLSLRYKRAVGLAVVGFAEKKGDNYFVAGFAAAQGNGIKKSYSWHMGGDLTMLKERGAVIGLNTLRLGLLEVN